MIYADLEHERLRTGMGFEMDNEVQDDIVKSDFTVSLWILRTMRQWIVQNRMLQLARQVTGLVQELGLYGSKDKSQFIHCVL
jgi:hypothetical protein